MTVVCICWLKLQKLNYNAQNGQCKILVEKENTVEYQYNEILGTSEISLL